MIELSCEMCAAPFRVKPYRRKKARFCSFACGGLWHAKSRLNDGRPKVHLVGNQHRTGKRPANAFRPEDVRGSANPRWQEGIQLQCEACGKSFKQKPWLERQNGRARFCTRTCFAESECFSGERSSSWVGGPQTYRGRGWKIVRMVVVAEQNGECAHCGKNVGQSLPVHHIRPFREFETADEANVRENLIGLCQSCHMKQEHMQQLDLLGASE